VSIRVNPEITLDAPHDYIKTGGKGHKFGVPYDAPLRRAVATSLQTWSWWPGYALGSQLAHRSLPRGGTERLASIFASWPSAASGLRYLDRRRPLRYDTEQPPDLDRFAELVRTVARAGGMAIMEPGRFLVATRACWWDACCTSTAAERTIAGGMTGAAASH
jgi:diaminopimelate decarboxylase